MAAITISRSLGSHGGRIARKLAKQLGWDFADKATINKVISQYGLIRLDDVYGDEPPRLRELFDRNTIWTIEWMNKTIATIAATRNAVILGRGGFFVLSGYSDVLNVHVSAPEELRAERIAKRDDITSAEALPKIEKNDKAREVFVRRFYGAKWADDGSYDLVVDTGELSDSDAIDRIVQEQARHIGESTGPKSSDIPVDPLLLQTIDQVMGERTA